MRGYQPSKRLGPPRRLVRALHVRQVVGLQVLALGVLDADQGDLAVGRDDFGLDRSLSAGPEGAGRIGRAEDLRQCRHGFLDPRDVGLRDRGVEEARLGVLRGEDDVRTEPDLGRARLREQFGGPVRVPSRCLERVLEVAAEGCCGGDHQEADRHPSSR